MIARSESNDIVRCDGGVRPVLTTAAGRERPLSGRPAMFGRASSMGLPTDPCDFLPKDFW